MDTEQYTWYRVTSSPEDGRLPKPGETVSLSLNGKKLCLANVEGQIYAVQDTCPHAMASLGQGWCEGEEVVCPVHRMRFNVKTGKGTTGEGFNIQCYAAEMREDGLYIGFEEKKWFQFWK